jgi:hypothetical protein
MNDLPRPGRRLLRLAPLLAPVVWFVLPTTPVSPPRQAAAADPQNEYAEKIQPLLKKLCLDCHSTKAKKGSLDLERFSAVSDLRADLKPWQAVIEMLEADEMPPKDKPQPTAAERKLLIGWVREFLDAEARSRAGDPGFVPLRRLSNAEYNATIRDLTGVDLQPAREFPADGAGGEGFTNAAEALTEVSPALLSKYLAAAKSVSDHLVLLPAGFRFSPATTRRDWTDESLAKLRQFYAQYSGDGNLPLQPYLTATLRHREELLARKTSIGAVAEREKLNAKYLGILWEALTSPTTLLPMEQVQARWKAATEKDVGKVLDVVKAWQAELWKVVKVGSYINGNNSRQAPNDALATKTRLSANVKPEPGQDEVTLTLISHDRSPQAKAGSMMWVRPRFEKRTGEDKAPLLLRDYAQFGPAYELSFSDVFERTHKYLEAAIEAARHKELAVADIARTRNLNVALLNRWIELTALTPANASNGMPGKPVPFVKLSLLEEKTPRNPERTAISGWHAKGSDLPVVIANSSDKTELVPGRVSAHGLAVHPTPQEFVAVQWKSPIAGAATIHAKVAHAHPACGNGVAWFLEHRRGEKATVMAEGVLELGQEVKLPAIDAKLEAGDLVILAVDARDGNHVCDLTEIALSIKEQAKPGQSWDLAADVANSMQQGNPHADQYGHVDAWSFVRGKARPPGSIGKAGAQIPAGSLLDHWRKAAADPAQAAESARLATELRNLLSGSRPTQAKGRELYDLLVSYEGPLLKGLNFREVNGADGNATRLGLPAERFGQGAAGKAANLSAERESATEIRLPAALFLERNFVVDVELAPGATEALIEVEVQVKQTKQTPSMQSPGKFIAAPGGKTHQQLLRGLQEFRECFPLFICYPHVIPVDETVCLKLYHREDEPLKRLFLSDETSRALDRLWEEHRFISQWPITENKNLPLFIGFVTQDQPKELVAYFEGMREPFRLRAEAFEKELAAAAPAQLKKLEEFATRAYRRPLTADERTQLLTLYRQLCSRGVSHDEAIRGVMARVLLAPAFLFRIESTPAGKQPGPVNDRELAVRLSYFLWSSMPDAELEQLAAAGRLHDPSVLAEQARRMVKDARLRSLAIEFGTQWIHVHGFDEFNEKNEKLFPTFDKPLRQAMYEESIRFFQDLFQSDQPVTRILDADYAFLNERLARHYGIPGVAGDQFRRVDGVQKYGRGGILGMASVQARQAGASRTSPVLRGNWVVETLLGEKLPRPPANVPRLPEEEGGNDGLTMRQLVEKHARAAECAVCHQRIDPFGFALEKYDPIGRYRDKDLGGLPLDCTARLKDGTEFTGIDGLRKYLATAKKDVVVRLFCRRLLGYALGRSTTLSDQPLIDEMMTELRRNDYRVSAALLVIVKSRQFTMIRGRGFE